nr:hypothetical protein [Marinobacter similis]
MPAHFAKKTTDKQEDHTAELNRHSLFCDHAQTFFACVPLGNHCSSSRHCSDSETTEKNPVYCDHNRALHEHAAYAKNKVAPQTRDQDGSGTEVIDQPAKQGCKNNGTKQVR